MARDQEATSVAQSRRAWLEAWLESIRRNWAVVLVSVFLSVVVVGAEATKKIHEALQAFGFARSEALDLAESTAKSNFSDDLARMAWLRLYWADVYAARVQNKAIQQDIDLAWQRYIESSAHWNAHLMVNIVGLERFYSEKKSLYFETEVQDSFRGIDREMSYLRRQELLVAGTPGAAGEVASRTANTRLMLYGFVRCFAPQRSNGQKVPASC